MSEAAVLRAPRTGSAARKRGKRNQPENAIPPLALAFIAILIFAGFCFLQRVGSNPNLLLSFALSAAVLLVFLLLLRASVRRAGRTLTYQFVPVKAHYVQLMMHSCIFAYWGWYWPEVYSHIPLILGQVAFVYALDMLVCWSRRDNWILGFGPVPIIFSTNLFLWFRDDWFWLQFLMIATGVLCKEFIRWDRDGVRKHIFNPSAIALFVFSIGLLLTHSTDITWGPQIAQTLHLPPYIYPEIFLLGLVVQGLFSVTMVTLAAAVMLYALNLAYMHATGVYYFVDSGIPVSVFIGLHLLVTDPATSPRRMTGKMIFGALYGAAVFALFGILGHFRAPQFYDKLLCVPFLNLAVRALDRFSENFAARFHPLNLMQRWGPQKLNFAQMGIWTALFSTMMLTGFIGYRHPGQSIAFWQKACAESRYNACVTWVHALQTDCTGGIAASCLQYGTALNEGRVVPASKLEGGEALGRACDLGLYTGCFAFNASLVRGGVDSFAAACDKGDNAACFLLGRAFVQGLSVARNDALAVSLFEKACGNGFPRACSALGQSYMSGRAGAPDPARARVVFERACGAGDAPACYGVGMLYVSGRGVQKDTSLALDRFRQACTLGMKNACKIVDGVNAAHASPRP
jgi:TPR repeat protein